MRDGVVLAGRFRIGTLLGSGASAGVYQATSVYGGETVAVKILHRAFSDRHDFREAFLAEAHLAQHVHHPNVVEVLDYGVDFDDDHPVAWIAYRRAPGHTLAELVAKHGALPVAQALAMTAAVAEGLQAIHEVGLVHRDITPHNIMVERDSQGEVTAVNIIDFGLMEVSGQPAVGWHVLHRLPAPPGVATAGVVGSAHYISPEQARGEGVDQRGDVYQLGCVLFFALIGLPPFPSPSLTETLQAHVRVTPLPPSQLQPGLTPAVDSLVFRALEKDPALRFASIAEFTRALYRVQQSGSTRRVGGGVTHVTSQASLRSAASTTNISSASQETTLSRVVRVGALPAVIVLSLILGLVLAAQGEANVASPSMSPTTAAPTSSSTQQPMSAIVPTLTGLSSSEAQAAIRKAGLTFAMQTVSDSPQASGTVISNKPASGLAVPQGASVSIVVASGFNVVPDVGGLGETQALDIVRSACFTTVVRHVSVVSGVAGTLVSTEPSAGSRAECGSTVVVTITTATPATATPSPTSTSTASPSASPSAT